MSMVAKLLALNSFELERLKADPLLLDSYLWPEPETLFDLHKSWAGIHFVLTGSTFETGANPIFWAVLGGEGIGEDFGYGPVRFLVPEEVALVAKTLDNLSEKEFRSKYDPVALTKNQVYPFVEWSNSEVLEDLAAHYLKMANYYRAAAIQHDAMLLWLS
jgi:hypothetical protein